MENTASVTQASLVAEIATSTLATREEIRKNTKTGRDTYKVPFLKIHPREGFNVRIDYGDIEGLANSILNHGLENPLTVDLLKDGTALLVDGYRRWTAYQWLSDHGHEVVDVECWVTPRTTTEEDRIFKMFVTQDNKQLEPVEAGEAFKRLENLGHSPETISKRLGKSITFVKNLIDLANEPMDIKNAVIQKRISASAVINLKKRVKNEGKRKAIVKDSIETGKKFKVKDAKSLEPNSPQFVMGQLNHLEDHLLGFYPEYRQAELRVVINYLRGTGDEESLLLLANERIPFPEDKK